MNMLFLLKASVKLFLFKIICSVGNLLKQKDIILDLLLIFHYLQLEIKAYQLCEVKNLSCLLDPVSYPSPGITIIFLDQHVKRSSVSFVV